MSFIYICIQLFSSRVTTSDHVHQQTTTEPSKTNEFSNGLLTGDSKMINRSNTPLRPSYFTRIKSLH